MNQYNMFGTYWNLNSYAENLSIFEQAIHKTATYLYINTTKLEGTRGCWQYNSTVNLCSFFT